MSKKHKRIETRVSPELWANLQQIAKDLGFCSEAGNPMMSKLINAIATRDFLLVPSLNDSASRQAIAQAIKVIETSNRLTPEESTRTRQVLTAYCPINDSEQISLLEAAVRKWIKNKQCFVLSYKGYDYNIRYAAIAYRYSPRQNKNEVYLDTWVKNPRDEPHYYPEPEALKHNRSFRLDTNFDVRPVAANWRDRGLDEMKLTLFLPNQCEQVSRYYLGDREELIEQTNQGVWIERPISSLYWFWREFAAREFAVVAPEECAKMCMQWRKKQFRAQLNWKTY